MPNHVRNILKFDAEGEALNKILDEIKKDEKGIGSIDFNKLIPMPPELNIEKGSNTTKGCELFERYSKRAESIINILKSNSLTPDKFVAAKKQKEALMNELNTMSDENKELFKLGKQFYQNVKNYGYGDWYDWSVANWGTKWNAYDFAHHDNTIEFNTAWECPKPIIRAISEKYPDITINHKWADDDIGTNLGEREYIKGDIIYQHQPDSFSKEAYDFAFDIWDEVPESYGLKLNADGTKYISVDEENNIPLLTSETDDGEDDELE